MTMICSIKAQWDVILIGKCQNYYDGLIKNVSVNRNKMELYDKVPFFVPINLVIEFLTLLACSIAKYRPQKQKFFYKQPKHNQFVYTTLNAKKSSGRSYAPSKHFLAVMNFISLLRNLKYERKIIERENSQQVELPAAVW